MKSKKVVIGIVAAILVVLCIGVAFLATQNEECDKKSHNELLIISYPIHLG